MHAQRRLKIGLSTGRRHEGLEGFLPVLWILLLVMILLHVLDASLLMVVTIALDSIKGCHAPPCGITKGFSPIG